MDPFELLKKDHDKVSQLFKQVESASGKAKLGVFKQIKSELDLHSHIEETILYPALEKAKETRDLTLEAYEEHKVVKDLLGELDAAKVVSDEWQAKLTVLQENVEHHVKEEENDLFDKAKDVLTNDQAESIGNRMYAEKVKRGGSAAAPETEKPGLLRTIASALGIGSSEASETKSAKKAAKKSGKARTESSGSKSSKGSSSSAAKKGKAAKKSAPAGGSKSRGNSSKKRASKKSVAATGRSKRPPAKKGSASKKARRGR